MAQSLDDQLQIADVYAGALFNLAREQGRIADVRAELQELVVLADREPTFAQFLASQVIDDDARSGSLDQMFRGQLSDLVLNTFQVMNRHGRAGLLRPLLRAFTLREQRASGQVEAIATSAVPLSEAERAQVIDAARKASGQEPLVEFTVDPAILGGLVLKIGDYRYDNSVRQKLHAARRRLHERAERGVHT